MSETVNIPRESTFRELVGLQRSDFAGKADAAYKGWVKHSNSLKFRFLYCFDELAKLCEYSASKHGKEVAYEKRILLIAAAES